MSKHSSSGSRWLAARARVLERDGHTCAHCGGEADTVDHVIAKVNGGTDEMSNLIAMCRTCNSRKGSRTLVRTAWFSRDWLDRL